MNPSRRRTGHRALALLAAVLAGCGGGSPPRDAAAPAAAPPAKGDAAAGADAAEAGGPVPVATALPLSRKVATRVEGFGRISPDPQSGRNLTLGTVADVRAVEVVAGQTVRAGQALLRTGPDPAVRLAARQAETARALAQRELARITEQRADNLATESQLDTARKALADAEAAVEAARQQGAAAPEQVLRAPIDGIVAQLGVGVGDRPAIGTVVLTLAPLRPARVTIGIEPAERRRVHAGDRVWVRAVEPGAVPRPARVAIVGASIDKESRLLPVTAVLDPQDETGLLPGGAIEATIEGAAVEAFLVPRSALVKDEAGAPAVFEIRDGKAHRVPVVVESDDGAHVAVSGALAPSRPIAATGAYELDEGVATVETRP